jgi:hypothetical protein
VRSWPLLVLAAPAAAEVWSGWAGIAQKTGFGLVSPLPGIWPSLHLDTTITLPVGVEAYAAYALRAWLVTGHAVSARTRRFAKWSAICSFCEPTTRLSCTRCVGAASRSVLSTGCSFRPNSQAQGASQYARSASPTKV